MQKIDSKDESPSKSIILDNLYIITQDGMELKEDKRILASEERAKKWTLLCEQLRKTFDALYEMCEQSMDVPATKEIIVLTQNSTRDFENLLNFFEQQEKWETAQSSNQKIAVSWEMRKSGYSPDKKNKPTPLRPFLLPICMPPVDEDGFILVQSRQTRRSARRSNISSNSSTSSLHEVITSYSSNDPLHPKSAMHIRQTRSSCMKMASSRRKLFEMRRSDYEEKLRRTRSNIDMRIPPPTHNAPDTQLRKAVSGYTKPTVQQKLCNHRSTPNSAQSSADRKSISLDSIQEENEKLIGPSPQHTPLPAKRDHSPVDVSTPVPLGSFNAGAPDSIPDDPVQTCGQTSSTAVQSEQKLTLREKEREDVLRSLTEDERSLAQEEEELNERLEEARSESIEERPLSKEEIQVMVENWTRSIPTSQNWALMAEEDYNERWQRQQLQGVQVRAPGECLQIHEKLSSPSRRKNNDPAETATKHHEKLEKASAQKAAIQAAKLARIQELTHRVEEVRAKRAQVQENMRQLIAERLKERSTKAEENRRQQLSDVIRKAKEEDTKIQQYSFINRIGRELKELDISERHEKEQQRLDDRDLKRRQEIETRNAKMHAAEERRRQQDEERMARHKETVQMTKFKQERAAAKRRNRVGTSNSISTDLMVNSTYSTLSQESSATTPNTDQDILIITANDEQADAEVNNNIDLSPHRKSDFIEQICDMKPSTPPTLNEDDIDLVKRFSSHLYENEAFECVVCNKRTLNDQSTMCHQFNLHKLSAEKLPTIKQLLDSNRIRKSEEFEFDSKNQQFDEKKKRKALHTLEVKLTQVNSQETISNNEHLKKVAADLIRIRAKFESIDLSTKDCVTQAQATRNCDLFVEVFKKAVLLCKEPGDVTFLLTRARIYQLMLGRLQQGSSWSQINRLCTKINQLFILLLRIDRQSTLNALLCAREHHRLLDILCILYTTPISKNTDYCLLISANENFSLIPSIISHFTITDASILCYAALSSFLTCCDEFLKKMLCEWTSTHADSLDKDLKALYMLQYNHCLQTLNFIIALSTNEKTRAMRSHKNGLRLDDGGWLTSNLAKSTLPTALAILHHSKVIDRNSITLTINLLNGLAMLDLRRYEDLLDDDVSLYMLESLLKFAIIDRAELHQDDCDIEKCRLCACFTQIGYIICRKTSFARLMFERNDLLTELCQLSNPICLATTVENDCSHARLQQHAIGATLCSALLANRVLFNAAGYLPTQCSPGLLSHYSEGLVKERDHLASLKLTVHSPFLRLHDGRLHECVQLCRKAQRHDTRNDI